MVVINERSETRLERESRKKKGSKSKVDGVIAGVFSLLSLLLIFGRLFIFTPYQVSGLSMSPTLGDGDKVVVSGEDVYERGDIIVFNSPVSEGETYIKRVVGVSGDTVSVKDGKVSVNGEEVLNKEQFGTTESFRKDGVSETYVPDGELFVLGDNRENSMDSRIFGTIEISEVRGKMVCRLSPIKNMHC